MCRGVILSKAQLKKIMKYAYKTKGTCSSAIELEINGESKVVEDMRFVGGCGGNTEGIARLVVGMPASDAIQKLKGIKCQNIAISILALY